MNKRGLNIIGLTIAFGVCIILPVWIIGFSIIPTKLKFLFTVFGGAAVFYFVEYGGIKRGVFTR